jgi:hypothetical protein
MGAFHHVTIGETQAGQDLFDLPVVVFFRCHQALHPLGQHGGFGEPDMLLHVTDAVPFGHGDGAVVGAFLADDDAKQGGLAVAVAAHQAHPLPRIDLEADAVEKYAPAEAFVQILDTDHGVVVSMAL